MVKVERRIGAQKAGSLKLQAEAKTREIITLEKRANRISRVP